MYDLSYTTNSTQQIVPCKSVVSKLYPSKFDFSRGDWQRTNKPEDLAIFGNLPDKFTFSLWLGLGLGFGYRVRFR